jgi:hypothetical protein
MTATPSSEARAEARAEAERRYPAPDFPGDNIGLRVGFVEGAEWKGAQDAEVMQAARDIYHAELVGGPFPMSVVLPRELYARLCDALLASGVESSDEGEADGELHRR